MAHQKLVPKRPVSSYPPFLRNLSKKLPKLEGTQPIVVNMALKSAETELTQLVAGQPVREVVDNYDEQYAELLLSQNAHLYRAGYEVQVASIADMLKDHYAGKQHWKVGSWVYYPWSQKLVHVLEQKDFEELRTIRNRDLITVSEQAKLWKFEAACFGMSVGSASALALALTGISRRIKLIDGAVISGSNLNRILTGVENVGQSKATVVGRQIYEMNPYSQVVYFDKIDSQNAGQILDKPWAVELVVDEIDDIEMKVKLRVEARRRRLPVVMATELGDSVMLDIERYDLEPDSDLFHGRLPGIEKLADEKLAGYREWMQRAAQIIDPINMPLKMQQSMLKIGTTIVTHPQLGSTVMMTGGAIAFAVKNIALGNDLKSGRYSVSLETMMLAEHKTRGYKRAHKKHTRILNKAIESM